MKTKATAFKWYCTCGASMTGSVSPESKLPNLRRVWDTTHTGEGHAPCDSKTAARARAKEEPETVTA